MLFSKARTIGERIVEVLLRSPVSVKKLHNALGEEFRGTSLRAVYKAVNQLIDDGVLIKTGMTVRVDEEWVRAVRIGIAPASTPSLSPGERMSYSFATVAHLDAFWKTIAFTLEGYEKDGQVFFYNPHNFWAHIPARRNSENAYYAHFSEAKRHAYFTVGGCSPADLEFKRTHQDEYLQISARAVPSLGRENHTTVLGSHVITVRLSKENARLIDALYASGRPSVELLPELLAILNGPFPTRFTLENNPAKAAKLRRILSQDYYFQSGT